MARMLRHVPFALAAAAVLGTLAPRAAACTAFALGGLVQGVVAKNFDFFTGQGAIFINKRGVAKRSAFIGPAAAAWVSRYGSVTVTQSGLEFPFEGMNEAGLVVTSLQLLTSLAPPVTDPRPAIDSLQLIQYLLDTSATLTEAVQATEAVRVAPGTILHYFVCDATLACATIESLAGQWVVHAGAALPYAALANSPYDESLAYLSRGLEVNAPAAILRYLSVASNDRFARAALWSSAMPIPGASSIDAAFAGLANVSQFVRDPSAAWRTYWSLVFTPAAKTLHLVTLAVAGVRSVDLGAFDLRCESGALMLDVNAPLTGDVTSAFQPWTADANTVLIEANPRLAPQVRAALEGYTASSTACLAL